MKRGLGIRNYRSVGEFSPLSLFAGGVQGAWFDPSDSTTLFSDRAGTTPCAAPGAGALVPVGLMLDKSGNANHATAANDTTARPELSARVNLLTRTEEFNVSPWQTGNTTVSANQTTAPDGTLTADLLYPASTGTGRYIWPSASVATVSAVTVMTSWYVKASSWTWVMLNGEGSANGVWFNIATGAKGTEKAGYTGTISDAGNGWWRITVTQTRTGTLQPTLWLCDADNTLACTASGTNGVFLWGADLRPANIGTTIPAYQRVADQYTYDTVGFPRYLAANGTSSAMSTPNNVNLSGTDKVTVFAGVRKLSDAAAGALVEFSANANSNNGSFYHFAPGGNSPFTGKYAFLSKGTSTSLTEPNSYPAPTTNVITGIGDIGGDVAQLRVNSSVAATNTADQGTGNFGSYPLFIGARNNASLWLNGYIYSLLVVGSAVSAGNITATETWVNGKTGGVY